MVAYEDGAVKIFLYTRGTEGNPSQNLIDMLKYIERSTEENIINQDIKRVDELVRHVKKSREVDIKYMKSWEWEKYIKRTATEEGRAEGREQGLKEGREEGRFLAYCELVQEGEMSLEKAAEKWNMSPEQFLSKMREAGYEPS